MDGPMTVPPMWSFSMHFQIMNQAESLTGQYVDWDCMVSDQP
jgi:hypothetical protein